MPMNGWNASDWHELVHPKDQRNASSLQTSAILNSLLTCVYCYQRSNPRQYATPLIQVFAEPGDFCIGWRMNRVAILVDGEFFLKRYALVYGRKHPPEKVAKNLFQMCLQHVSDGKKKDDYLYRIFFYDCPPFDGKAHNPVTGKAVDFSKTDVYAFRMGLSKELMKKRKIALRRGRLGITRGWILKPARTKALLEQKLAVDDLDERDVFYDITQKGVDMRIGLDIASLAYKHLVDKIVLVSGDADFVPAAKLARREGIDFVLDPMWQRIGDDLFEHIDGLQSVCKRPNLK